MVAPSCFSFDVFTFDARTGELKGPDGTVGLAKQPAMVLSVLLANAGTLVTRTQLQEKLWPDRVVEFDMGLNYCVREVRAALRDHAASPRFIETRPRRGYRFIGTVHPVPETDARRDAGYRRFGLTAVTLVCLVAGLALAMNRATPVPNPAAREASEMGGWLLQRGEADDIARSINFFREAISVEPEYARAWYGLGSAYLLQGREEEGTTALRRSVAIDPDQWAPWIRLGLRAFYQQFDRTTGIEYIERAIEAAPKEVTVRHIHAWALAAAGDLGRAIDEMRVALSLDPVSPRVNGDVGRLFYLAGRNDAAIAHCRRTAELTPDALRPRDCIVHALVEKQALVEAAAEARHTIQILDPDEELPSDGSPPVLLAHYWRWSASMISTLAIGGQASHVHAAAAWARAGDADRAFEALETAYAMRCPVLAQVELDPALALIDGDPRFGRLVSRMHPASLEAPVVD